MTGKAPVILADDLSGAMETAAVFLKNGWHPAIPLEGSNAPVGTLPVISTETRALAPAAARAELRRIATDLKAQGRELLFKKIDSTMRGPVGAELQAVCDVWPERPVFFTSANPTVGRTVENGVLLVNGVRITQTPFRNDPGSPIVHDEVVQLLAASGCTEEIQNLSLAEIRQGIGPCSEAVRQELASGECIFVCDAQTMEDLHTIVDVAYQIHPAPLFVGASALGEAVAAKMRPDAPATSGAKNADQSLVRGGVLYICGSKHPASHRQIRELGIPVRVLPVLPENLDGFVRTLATDLRESGQAAAMSLDFPGAPGDALAVMETAVARVNQTAPVAALFATGGETARALCQRIGGTSLALVAEIEPGVIAARMQGPDGVRLVITKPGGYGDDQTLVHVRSWLASALK